MTDNKKSETVSEQSSIGDSENESTTQISSGSEQHDNNLVALSQNENFQFFVGRYSRIQDHALVDKIQRSGRLAPVFGPPSIAKEEKYIEKMLKKDRKLNRG